ncbi:MAG: hypothetical protein KDB82_00955 [Planctomycetes bacterium]|nr:hypothetical protein [Planctomycetota bacterium]
MKPQVIRIGRFDDARRRFDPFLDRWIPTKDAESVFAAVSVRCLAVICCGPYETSPDGTYRYVADAVVQVDDFSTLSSILAVTWLRTILDSIPLQDDLSACTSVGVRLTVTSERLESIPSDETVSRTDTFGRTIDLISGWCNVSELEQAHKTPEEYFTVSLQ